MAIRITRVYTRTGDGGDTALVGGTRVPKDSGRLDAYGTLDELNAAVGMARACNAQTGNAAARDFTELLLQQLQNDLFDLGSELATPPEAFYEGMFRVGSNEVTALEQHMDALQKDLAPLNSFILPGGGPVSAALHHCRTVCRRAERVVVRLMREEDIGPWPVRYLNRLGDLLFVLSRWAGKQAGESEHLWQRGLRAHERRGRKKG